MSKETEQSLIDEGPTRSTPQRRKRRYLRWVIPLAVVVVIAGVVTGVLLSQRTSGTSQTVTRDVRVAMITMSESVSTTGTIEPQQRADLGFSSSGTVTSVKVSVGDKVTTGQALASIDLTDLQASLDSAQAAVDAAQSDYNTAVDSGVDARITAAKSALAAKKNNLANAKTALAAGTLTAPFDGIVAIVSLALGDTVGSGSGGGGGMQAESSSSSSSVITVITADRYSVTTSVGASDVTKIAKGQDVRVTPSGFTDSLPGTVTSVGLIASSSSSSGATFPVTIDITDSQDGLFSGVSATVTITTSSREVLAVPTAAITINQEKATVLVRNQDGSTTVTEVTTGEVSNSMTEITSGLAEGDTVVIEMQVTSNASNPSNPLSGLFPGGDRGQRPSGDFTPAEGGPMPEGDPGQRPGGFDSEPAGGR